MPKPTIEAKTLLLNIAWRFGLVSFSIRTERKISNIPHLPTKNTDEIE
jgi:hypothetical protein